MQSLLLLVSFLFLCFSLLLIQSIPSAKARNPLNGHRSEEASSPSFFTTLYFQNVAFQSNQIFTSNTTLMLETPELNAFFVPKNGRNDITSCEAFLHLKSNPIVSFPSLLNSSSSSSLGTSHSRFIYLFRCEGLSCHYKIKTLFIKHRIEPWINLQRWHGKNVTLYAECSYGDGIQEDEIIHSWTIPLKFEVLRSVLFYPANKSEEFKVEREMPLTEAVSEFGAFEILHPPSNATVLFGNVIHTVNGTTAFKAPYVMEPMDFEEEEQEKKKEDEMEVESILDRFQKQRQKRSLRISRTPNLNESSDDENDASIQYDTDPVLTLQEEERLVQAQKNTTNTNQPSKNEKNEFKMKTQALNPLNSSEKETKVSSFSFQVPSTLSWIYSLSFVLLSILI